MTDEKSASAKTVDISCNFIGDFEVADNMVRNAEALCALKSANKDGMFNKLMVIQAGSIVEVGLAQIIYRAQNYNREGVPNISEEDRLEIADKKVDKLNNIIQLMKKYKILDGLGVETIYDELHKLRKYRNKVHIQDDVDIAGVSRREDRAFNDQTVAWSLELCQRVLRHLNEKFPRPDHVKPFARTLSLPT
jgi:Asp-tRNA(Asn)/Glu-tRNA(Gln) amidotransferase C subunit